MTATFISYRREDAAGYAGRLRESLERRLGHARVFRDVDVLRPGQDFVQAIEARLAECRVMLVVIGREWLDARHPDGRRRLDDPFDFVRLEVATALARPGVLVVPVLVENAAMPAAAALPDGIQILARRHAVSVRDETWDADVDRLVALIEEAEAGSRPSRADRLRPWLPWLGAAAVLAATAVLVLPRVLGERSALSKDSPEQSTQTVSRTSTPDAAVPFAIDIPQVAEAAFDHLVYSVVSGNLVPRGTARELRLRIRLSNSDRTPVNFWDESFRLSVGADTLPPTSQLNAVLDGHSLAYNVITFAVPRDVTSATLRIHAFDRTADIPLDLTPTGRAPVDEQAPVADSLAQAQFRNLSVEPAAWLEADGIAVSLERVVRRRFANTNRLTLSLRLRNDGRTDRFGGELVLRAATADGVVGPWQEDIRLPAQASVSATAVFDLPPSATTAALSARLGQASAERTFDLR